MEWPCSERFVSEYEVASVARSTGAPESKESCRVATPDPESLAVQVTVTSFESAYESGAGAVIETEGAFGSKWKGTVTLTEFPARSVTSKRITPVTAPSCWASWTPNHRPFGFQGGMYRVQAGVAFDR